MVFGWLSRSTVEEQVEPVIEDNVNQIKIKIDKSKLPELKRVDGLNMPVKPMIKTR